MRKNTKTDDSAQAHAQAQRNRILDAAEHRFIEHGFRAATMAAIAGTAGISPGLIYRYFESKQAIILAIIDRHLARNRDALGQLELSTDLVAELLEAYDLWSRGDPRLWHVALFAEATAEAGRDPDVGRALRESDRTGRQALVAWLQRRDGEQVPRRRTSTQALQARAFMLQCLAEGLAVHAVREPDLDRELLEDMLRLAAPSILPR